MSIGSLHFKASKVLPVDCLLFWNMIFSPFFSISVDDLSNAAFSRSGDVESNPGPILQSLSIGAQKV